MGGKIIFAPQALEKLEQIVRFIAQDDPTAAVRFGDYLLDRAELLKLRSPLKSSNYFTHHKPLMMD
jgi:plasmid stabilization system protein ParE